MKCAWQELLSVLPSWLKSDTDNLGKESLQEIRLRTGCTPELILKDRTVSLRRTVRQEDITFVINTASRYSPWAAATASSGFLTAPGGHRIGICGDAVCDGGHMKGIRTPTSLCIRVARDFPGISAKAVSLTGSVLIIGRPGSGKTTLLRDLIRQRSNGGRGSVCVVDERGELFPRTSQGMAFDPGYRTDVISGCSKDQGIRCVLRSMGPEWIAVDEITEEADCRALTGAGWCGVQLMATAHASSVQDLYSRPVYRPILESKLFDSLLVMQPDKSWRTERMRPCT